MLHNGSALLAIKHEVLRLDFAQQEDELTIKVAVVLRRE